MDTSSRARRLRERAVKMRLWDRTRWQNLVDPAAEEEPAPEEPSPAVFSAVEVEELMRSKVRAIVEEVEAAFGLKVAVLEAELQTLTQATRQAGDCEEYFGNLVKSFEEEGFWPGLAEHLRAAGASWAAAPAAGQRSESRSENEEYFDSLAKAFQKDDFQQALAEHLQAADASGATARAQEERSESCSEADCPSTSGNQPFCAVCGLELEVSSRSSEGSCHEDPCECICYGGCGAWAHMQCIEKQPAQWTKRGQVFASGWLLCGPGYWCARCTS